ncbi:MAG TPA: hypothetical protein VFE46_12185 [Pirellulales bacterium]|nr:hypothetical protein [Pirellulales bacterium]
MPNSINSQGLLDGYRWLVGPDGGKWLEKATSMAAAADTTLVGLTSKLRQALPPHQVQLLLEQLELRRRARERFSQAQRMFFTPLALEQATDEHVARYKASRFLPGMPLADLCCGIGGDLLALSQRGPAWAIDRNRVAVLLAETNVRSLLECSESPPKTGVKFDVTDASDAGHVLEQVAAWHIDPDRRASGGRVTKIALQEPGPEILQRMLTACPHAAIKLASAADLVEPWWNEAELEWISRGRQCRQLVAWFGNLAQYPGQRRATMLRTSANEKADQVNSNSKSVVTSFFGSPGVECPLAAKIGRYVFEPDAAILAAKIEGAVAAEHGLLAFAPGVAYFTADKPIDHGGLTCFEVVEVMPYRVNKLRSWLAQRGISRLEVKKRGVPLDPQQVRGELLPCGNGGEEATLLLARVGRRITAIIAKRFLR